MMRCPLCGEHEIEGGYEHIAFPFKKKLCIRTFDFDDCEKTQEKITSIKPIIVHPISYGTTILIYEVGDEKFQLIFQLSSQGVIDNLITDPYSLDETRQIIERLRFLLISVKSASLEENRPMSMKVKDTRINLAKMVLHEVSKETNPLFEALHEQALKNPDK